MAANASTQPRVLFQTSEKVEEETSHHKLGKLTVKYNRKDLQRRLDIEEWIDGQLHLLYDCEDFINGLLYRIKGVRKMSTTQRK
ncbi:UNVERIFIED_CONTAM: hypothetical protein FKN15_038425 [Acipenser sinensis]